MVSESAKSGAGAAGSAGLQVKTPKGTRDWAGPEMDLRDSLFATLTSIFRRHGGMPLDTPAFERTELLTNKYGEDSKLIYDLQDQGGELCSLRYDLTIPWARWLAMNPQMAAQGQGVKRYQIGKVYRRDQPSVARGRMREFFQCDFDTAGAFDPMITDAEIVTMTAEAFQALGLPVTIKINHRKILDGLFAVAGVSPDKFRPVSSAVDKLDKTAWEEVRRELVEEKGLAAEVADRVGELVRRSGPATAEFLRAPELAGANADVRAGLDDMDLLFRYLDAYRVPRDTVSFDLSLARGLDYYTDIIFEVVLDASRAAASEFDFEPTALQVGSIAGGGRYDNLVGMFSRRQIPCVGISFGIDRILAVLRGRRRRDGADGGEEARQRRRADVYVMAFGGGKDSDGLLAERMAVAKDLWDGGIRAEFSSRVRPKLPQQFKAAESGGVPLAVIMGGDEVAAGKVRLKVLGVKEGEEKEGRLVARADLVAEVKALLEGGPKE